MFETRFGIVLVCCAISVGVSPLVAQNRDLIGWGTSVFDSSLHRESFVAIGAGEVNSFAVRADGTVAGIGFNGAPGQTYGFPLDLPALPPGTGYTKVAGGSGHTLLLRSDGVIVGAGHPGFWGILNIPSLPAGVVYVDLAASDRHALARRSDGAVVAWGDNATGQCNVPALPAGVTYVEIAVGRQHSLARRSDGSVVAFGDNSYGQCNVPFGFGQTFLRIAAGDESSYGIASSLFGGGIIQWGAMASSGVAPPAGSATAFTRIAAGLGFAVALRTNGTLAVWGPTGSAAATITAYGLASIPPLPAGVTYTAVSSSPNAGHVVALRSDGRFVCWGRNDHGQCNTPRPPDGRFITGFGGLGEGGSRFVLLDDGTIRPWATTMPNGLSNVPALPAGTTYLKVDGGFFGGVAHACALRSDGVIVAWGSNIFGQTAVPALPPGVTYVDVQVAFATNLALRSDGQIVGWGATPVLHAAPPLPPGLTYTRIAFGFDGAAAIRSDGAVVTWSGNPPTSTLLPPPGLPYVDVAAGASGRTIALRSDGAVIGWSPCGAFFPPSLPAGRRVVQAAAGQRFLVLLNDDSAFAWTSGCIEEPNYAVPVLPAGRGFTGVFAGPPGLAALVSDTISPTVASIGIGCPGTNGIPTLASSDVPFIGNSAFTMNVALGAPSSQSYLFVATAEAAPPVPIGPGCWIYLDVPNAQVFIGAGLSPLGPAPTTPVGDASFVVSLPYHPALAGFSFYFQAAVLDTSVPLGLTMTNALRVVLN